MWSVIASSMHVYGDGWQKNNWLKSRFKIIDLNRIDLNRPTLKEMGMGMGMGMGQLYAGMDGNGDDLETTCGDRGGDGY